jgi:hypothetical protein
VHIGQIYFYTILKIILDEIRIILKCKIKEKINEGKNEGSVFLQTFYSRKMAYVVRTPNAMICTFTAITSFGLL